MEQLAQWLIENCYNNFILIGGSRNQYGDYTLKKTEDGRYIWYFFDRTPTAVKEFKTEQEAVEFAFTQINDCETWLRHPVGFIRDTKDKREEIELIDELNRRNIKFSKDQIPYDIGDIRIRVFVFGCDIKKVLDLRDKYIPQKSRH